MHTKWRLAASEIMKHTKRFSPWSMGTPSHQVFYEPPPPSRLSRRSQLRFSPSQRMDRWTIPPLMKTHSLLKQGEEQSALEFCLDTASFFQEGWLEFVHAAVSLFTRHHRFEAALSLCDRMVNDGFLLPNKTFMLLLRGVVSQDAEYLERVSDVMLRNGVKMDDMILKALLDTMLIYCFPPEALEEALGIWQKSRGVAWVPTVSIFSAMVQAWSFSGNTERAEYWLSEYRSAHRARGEPDRSPQISNSRESSPEDVLMHSARERHIFTSDNPRTPYAALLVGYLKSPKPVPERIQWLIHTMQDDGVTLNVDMCNMIIRAFADWDMMSHASHIFNTLLAPSSSIHPDSYTFRHLFIALNPSRRRNSNKVPQPSEALSSRRVFSEMIRFYRLQLRPRKPLPHKNIISAATFNCALKTFCAQNDYAAAWTVLTLFTWYGIIPERKTSQIVVHSLLRRMRFEMGHAYDITDVLWMDRFSNERRSSMLAKSNRMLHADRLYMIGRISVTKMKEERLKHYLKIPDTFDDRSRLELEFLVGLLHSALRAELGFQSQTFQVVEAERAISDAMSKARRDMLPPGRS